MGYARDNDEHEEQVMPDSRMGLSSEKRPNVAKQWK